MESEQQQRQQQQQQQQQQKLGFYSQHLIFRNGRGSTDFDKKKRGFAPKEDRNDPDKRNLTACSFFAQHTLR